MSRLSAEAVAAAGGKEAVMREDEQAPAQRGHRPPRYPDTPAKRAASSEHPPPGGARWLSGGPAALTPDLPQL